MLLRAWREVVVALGLLLSATQAFGHSTTISLGDGSQGWQAVHERLTDLTGAAEHLGHLARQLQQAGARGSGWLAGASADRQQQQRSADRAAQGGSAGAATAASDAAGTAADGSTRRPIWVMIGGERFDATAGGLEYEDGEEAERSAPADGPLKHSRLPAGLVRRHLKIAPYKTADFAAQRAAAWQQILDGQ